MEPRLQRRIQRYGWDLAAVAYEPAWRAQLARVHARMLASAALAPGETVLDIACGTGLITFAAAQAVGARGHVLGTDLSAQMLATAQHHAEEQGFANVRFSRMDAEDLALADASFDAALCALGLMFVPDAGRAVQEMRRVLRPGGRLVIGVWGERSKCGWSTVFPIVEAEVTSEVCPLFFRMGQGDTLARACAGAGCVDIEQHRLDAILAYANPGEACRAALVGGPVALAWSRFDDDVRARVARRYLESIERWRRGDGYRIPAEFVVVAGRVSG